MIFFKLFSQTNPPYKFFIENKVFHFQAQVLLTFTAATDLTKKRAKFPLNDHMTVCSEPRAE